MVRRRTRAGWIDVGLLFIVGLVFSLLFGQSHAGDGSVSISLSGGPFLAWIAIWFLYHAGWEAATGQSLGKKLAGIRVVMRDGAPARLGPVIVRTLFRAIDVLPFFYLLGWILMRSSRPTQRLGDMVAGTTLVPVGGGEAPPE